MNIGEALRRNREAFEMTRAELREPEIQGAQGPMAVTTIPDIGQYTLPETKGAMLDTAAFSLERPHGAGSVLAVDGAVRFPQDLPFAPEKGGDGADALTAHLETRARLRPQDIMREEDYE